MGLSQGPIGSQALGFTVVLPPFLVAEVKTKKLLDLSYIFEISDHALWTLRSKGLWIRAYYDLSSSSSSSSRHCCYNCLLRVRLMPWLKCRSKRATWRSALSYPVDPIVELGVRHISPLSHLIVPNLLFLVSTFWFFCEVKINLVQFTHHMLPLASHGARRWHTRT